LAVTIRTRKWNATVLRTVARCGLIRSDTSVSAQRKRKRVRSGFSPLCHPLGWLLFLAVTIRTRKRNATVLRTVARCGLDRSDTSVSAQRKRKRVRSGSSPLCHPLGWLFCLTPLLLIALYSRFVYLLPLVPSPCAWYNLPQEEST